jgi:hypothetical protein
MGHHKAPVEFNRADAQAKAGVSQFAGMPVGIELHAKWFFKDFSAWDPASFPEAAAGVVADTPGDAWTTTVTGTGNSALSDDLVPPRLVFTPSGADNDSIESQYTGAEGYGEAFALRSGKKLYFRCSFSLSDANNDINTVEQADLFLGLSITDTTVIDGATDFIGFSKVDASGLVNFVAGKNASTSGALVDQLVSSTGVTLVAADAGTAEADIHTFEFVAVGTNTVHIYADGAYVRTVNSTTQLPDDENMCVTIAIQNGTNVAKVLNLSQLLVAMER